MSLCPICRRALCDHTPEERGQTKEEMMAPLTPDEEAERMERLKKEIAALPPKARELFIIKE